MKLRSALWLIFAMALLALAHPVAAFAPLGAAHHAAETVGPAVGGHTVAHHVDIKTHHETADDHALGCCLWGHCVALATGPGSQLDAHRTGPGLSLPSDWHPAREPKLPGRPPDIG